jgi:RNA polymerase sigma factor (sigma-70 family)
MGFRDLRLEALSEHILAPLQPFKPRLHLAHMPSLQAVEIPADVLARARAGNGLAQESIYRELSKPVYTLIRRLVIRPAIAEELLQDVFVEVLRSLPKYSGAGSFLGWVRSIAVNKALMYLRSPWHRSLSFLGADGVMALHEHAVAPMDEALDADLERALARLSPISRAVVWLYDVEGLTHAEIARLFGRTISFSKSQLARAHEQLREGLEPKTGGLACTPISRHF